MNIDVIRENVSLPPLNAGDQVVVHSVGAYNVTQSMQFIALRPAVVLIDRQGKTHLIRQRETLDILQKDERVPEYLSTH
jgi:diaminopimelate decarboxylase